MELISEFQDGGHLGFSRWPPLENPTFANNSRTKHDRKENSTGNFKFRVSEFKKIIFEIPRWRPSWNSRWPPFKNLLLLITRELNMIGRKTQREFLSLALASLRKLLLKFRDGGHLGFQDGRHSKTYFCL